MTKRTAMAPRERGQAVSANPAAGADASSPSAVSPSLPAGPQGRGGGGIGWCAFLSGFFARNDIAVRIP